MWEGWYSHRDGPSLPGRADQLEGLGADTWDVRLTTTCPNSFDRLNSTPSRTTVSCLSHLGYTCHIPQCTCTLICLGTYACDPVSL